LQEKKGGTMQKRSARGSVERLQRRYTRLVERLGKTGLILQGTILDRTIVQPHPKDPGKEKTLGPYYQWTFKRAGKTITVNLSASQAKTYRKAIANHRRMEKILRQMREMSLQILEATTAGVRRKKHQNQPQRPLS
jgi:hypothetical protein